jgi:hypothetical protein
MIRWREAQAGDVAAIVALLSDDVLGAARETTDLTTYEAAFARMQKEGANRLIVGEDTAGRIVATYQIVMISGLSLRAALRSNRCVSRPGCAARGSGRN